MMDDNDNRDDIDILDDWDATILSDQPRQFVERRKRNDWVVRTVTIIAVLGWIAALLALLFIQRSNTQPWGFETTYPERLGGVGPGGLSTSLLRWAFIATLFSFVACLVGFIFNAARHRRKTDRFNKLLISISVASTVLFVVFLVSFSQYL